MCEGLASAKAASVEDAIHHVARPLFPSQNDEQG
jgi:hypothetical protein